MTDANLAAVVGCQQEGKTPLWAVSKLVQWFWLRPGRKAVLVELRGCMAHIREERDRGTLVRRAQQVDPTFNTTIDGIMVQWEKRGLRFEVLQYTWGIGRWLRDGHLEVET